MKFINISNHNLTQVQIEDLNGIFNTKVEIVELPEILKEKWSKLTPFNYDNVCKEIIKFMSDNNITHGHLAGFAPAIVYLSEYSSYMFYYAYSEKISQEKEINGEVFKTSIFKHKGFYLY